MEFAVEAQKLLGVCLEGSGRLNSPEEPCNSLPLLEDPGPSRRRSTKTGPRSSGASTSSSGRAKCTRSWARTAPARARSLTSWRAGRGYVVTQGAVLYGGRTSSPCRPRSARAKASSSRSSTPVEIPGVKNTYFLRRRGNTVRKHRGEPELDAMDFLTLARREGEARRDGRVPPQPPVNEGFSGGEKKRNEILQMAVLEPRLAILDETYSGLDIDALRVVAAGVNAFRAGERCDAGHHPLPAPPRLIVPDFVHVLSDGRIVNSGDRTSRWSWRRRATPGSRRSCRRRPAVAPAGAR